MSDNENMNNAAAAAGDEKIGGMAEADVKFLIACLRNTTGGSITVSLPT
jgi:hypothetical protein